MKLEKALKREQKRNRESTYRKTLRKKKYNEKRK